METALTKSIVAGISQEQWQILKEQAAMLVKTGFLPTVIKTPEQAVAIMLKARELNIPAMYGLGSISVIQGKPTCSAELMLALIYRDQGDDAITIEKSDSEGCCVSYKRAGWKETRQHIFTMEDAKRAGITANPSYTKYPAAMLRARCISAVARMAFPDSIGGMYTPDELEPDEPEESTNTIRLPRSLGKPTGVVVEIPAGITKEIINMDTGEIVSPVTSEAEDIVAPLSSTTGHELRIGALRLGLGWTHAQVRDVARQMFGKHITTLHDLQSDQQQALAEELDAVLATHKSTMKK